MWWKYAAAAGGGAVVTGLGFVGVSWAQKRNFESRREEISEDSSLSFNAKINALKELYQAHYDGLTDAQSKDCAIRYLGGNSEESKKKAEETARAVEIAELMMEQARAKMREDAEKKAKEAEQAAKAAAAASSADSNGS